MKGMRDKPRTRASSMLLGGVGEGRTTRADDDERGTEVGRECVGAGETADTRIAGSTR